MASKIDGKDDRESISRVDVQAMAGRVLDGLGDVRGQDPGKALQGALAAVAEQGELERTLSDLTLAAVAEKLGSRDADRAEITLPASLPIVLAVASLDSRAASTVRVRVGEEEWLLERDSLAQLARRARESFVRRSSRALRKRMAILPEEVRFAPLGMGKVFDRIVARMASGVLYYQCVSDTSHPCFESYDVPSGCATCGGPVKRVSRCP
jgi:hypothetical protein